MILKFFKILLDANIVLSKDNEIALKHFLD